MSIRDFFKLYYKLLLSFLIIFLLGLISLLTFGSRDFSIFLNGYNHPLADLFFKYITYVGDGITAFIITLLIIFFSRKIGLMLLGSLLISTGLTQILKRVIFDDIYRPSYIFKDLINNGHWHLVEGVHLFEKYSFPSGHTATVFCVCIFIALIINHKVWSIGLVFLAFIVGLSRIYLSQHFLIDVLTGAFIGSLSSFIVFLFFKSTLLKNKRNEIKK